MHSVLLPSMCALVPHSAKPVWHDWGCQRADEADQNGVKKSTTARRRLFQEDVNGAETDQKFVRHLLDQLAEQYKLKWGFDFETGRPLAGVQSRFEYEALPADSVPGFYRTSSICGGGGVGSPVCCSLNNSDVENNWPVGVGNNSDSDGEGHRRRRGRTPEAEEHNDDGTVRSATDGGGAVLLISQETDSAKKSSPANARILRKARRSTHTPRKQRLDQQQEGTTKLTEFLGTRKHLSSSTVLVKEEHQEKVLVGSDSPHHQGCNTEQGTPKRSRRTSAGRRHSSAVFPVGTTPPKKETIARRRRNRRSSVAAALFE